MNDLILNGILKSADELVKFANKIIDENYRLREEIAHVRMENVSLISMLSDKIADAPIPEKLITYLGIKEINGEWFV